MLELAVLGIDAIGVEANDGAARSEFAIWRDVVSGKQMDGCSRCGDYLGYAEFAVRIVVSRARALDMRARDLRAASDIVPQDIGHTSEEVGHHCFAPLLLVG